MKLNILFKIVIVCVLVMAFSISAISSECKAPQLNVDTGYNWTKDSLDGNDAPYKQIRLGIDSLVNKGTKARDLAKRYKITAQQHPSDAETMFRWAYAAYIASDHWNRDVRSTKELCGIYGWMGQPKNPKSFEYARLRFLMSRFDENWPYYGDYSDFAKRLVAKGAKTDFNLRFFAIRAIAMNLAFNNNTLLEEVFKLALQLRKDFPKRAETLFMLGGIYSSRFAVYKRDQLANLSIQYTRQYLATNPLNPAMIRSAKDCISTVEKVRKIFKKRGELKP